MNDWMFKTLTPDEEDKFRQWARENWKPNKEPSDIWHPVVRDEWTKITQELNDKEAANEHR